MNPSRKIILFTFVVLLPALTVGISNAYVFPDSFLLATILLIVTVGIAAVFTWFSGEATPKIARYCILADILICAILVVNVGGHWMLAREVSAAKQGVEERHAEEDREEIRKAADVEQRLKLAEAEAKLAKEQAKAAYQERRRLAALPVEQRRSVLSAPKSEPAPSVSPLSLVPVASAPVAAIKPKLTPEQVRERWWWFLTALAIAECAASVLAGAILAGVWEWDRNRDGIPDHLQAPKAVHWPIEVGK